MLNYIFHILILVNVYAMLALSLNLIAGYTGILSVAHAAMFGIGAYTAALLDLHFGTPFLVNVIVAMFMAGTVGLLVGLPSLRISEDYFILATVGLQVVLHAIMNNWTSLTRGPLGLPGIGQPTLLGWKADNHWEFLLLSTLMTGIVFLISYKLVGSPFGRTLKAIREDEIFSQSIRVNVTANKLSVFAVGSALGSVAGVLYAQYISFIDPTTFTLLESIFILSIVIIGGAGNLLGSLAGAILLVTAPEILRFLGVPSTIIGNVRQILYGTLLVLFMAFRPRGMFGEYDFRSRKKR